MIYKVCAVWTECALVDVEADSLDEAIELVLAGDVECPQHGDYVDDSLDVDYAASAAFSGIE